MAAVQRPKHSFGVLVWLTQTGSKQNRLTQTPAPRARLPPSGPRRISCRFCRIDQEDGTHAVEQLAAYRPRGLAGRLYWYAVLPLYDTVVEGMIKNLVRYGA